MLRNVNPSTCLLPTLSILMTYCVQKFCNVSSIKLSVSLSALLKMYFIFVRREALFRGEWGEKGGMYKACLKISEYKMRACSVYNGLILCRRHCFTIVAHNWKFWQMYFAWTIVLKLYMCICIVLWMYFLILTPGLSVNFLLSCLLYCLFEDFPGTLACVSSGSPLL